MGDHYPAQNPHFGAIGPNGLNLGLFNVNPLVSVQVKKTEFGENVVKPLVNLHITPSANIFDAVGNLFKPKPNIVHNSHYHHHEHFSGFDHDHHHDDHVFTSPGPISHHFPSFHKYDIEMIPSKPIFEYHSGPQIYTETNPIHHYEDHHKEHYEHVSSHISSFSHTDHGHSSSGSPEFYPSIEGGLESSPHPYPSTGAGFEHAPNHFPTTGGANLGPSLPAPDIGGHEYPPLSHSTIGSGYEPNFNHLPTGGANLGPSLPPQGLAGNEFPPLGPSPEYGGNQGFENYENFPPQGYPTGFGTSGFENPYDRSSRVNQSLTFAESQRYRKGKELGYGNTDLTHPIPTQAPGAAEGSPYITFPKDRKRRSLEEHETEKDGSVLLETAKIQEV